MAEPVSAVVTADETFLATVPELAAEIDIQTAQLDRVEARLTAVERGQ